MTRLILGGFAVLILVLQLAACGKVGSPSLPPEEHSTFPRAYPSGNTD